MERNKLTSAKSIRSYLTDLIQESLENAKKSRLHQATLDEKDKQDSLSSLGGDEENDDLAAALGDDEGQQTSDQKSQPNDQKVEPKQDDQENDSSSDDSDSMARGDVSFDDIVEKLNTIRSGKSFKDSAIKDAFQKYVDDLSDAERTALFAFLKGISQIVTGEISGEKAMEPKEDPASVQMKKNSSNNVSKPTSPGPAQKKTIKPNVIKSPGSQTQPEDPQKHDGQKKSNDGAEDSRGPVPVVAKRRGA